MRALGIHIAALTGLAATPALACSPAPMVPAAKPTLTEGCTVNWAVSEYEMIGLSAAEPLANGYVLQSSYAGNGCTGSVGFVLSDCGTGEVIILSGLGYDLMSPESRKKIEGLEARLKSLAKRGRLTLERAGDEGEKAGMTEARWSDLSGRLELAGKKIALECGCRKYGSEASRQGG